MARKKPETLREMKTDELEQQLAVLTEERFRWDSGALLRRSGTPCSCAPSAARSRGSTPFWQRGSGHEGAA